jgi:hypothetical protein
MVQPGMTAERERETAAAARPKALRDDPDRRPSEDDLARAHLGPRGVPGAPDPAKMTSERRKKTPRFHGIPPEHPK